MYRLIVIALAAFYVTEFLRRLPVIEGWTMRGIRPFACATCMAGWTALLVGAFATEGTSFERAIQIVSGAGLALVILAWRESTIPPPPPPLE